MQTIRITKLIKNIIIVVATTVGIHVNRVVRCSFCLHPLANTPLQAMIGLPLITFNVSGASHLSFTPNTCYSAAFQLAGKNCLQLTWLRLAGSLYLLTERFTNLR